MKILIINPNSTVAMTQSLTNQIESLRLTLNIPASTNIEYYTASKTSSPAAPESINNQNEAGISTNAVINDLQENHTAYLSSFQGYLVACYSDHPLVEELRKYVNPTAVVMGIFQASMLYALQYATQSNKAAILTSGADWEMILDEAMIKFCDSSIFPSNKFEKTLAVGVPVLKLHELENYPVIRNKIESLIARDTRIILLGCAGLSCLTDKLKDDFPNLKFVDSVVTGLKLIISYIEMEN